MIARLLGPLLAVACLAGCTVQMAYNHLDRLARWSVSDYVDLDEDQQQLFDARFDELWRWHRHEQLPQYAALLDALPAQLEDGATDAELQALTDRLLGWGEEIQDRALPAAAEVLSTLSDEQVSDMARKLTRRNREVAEPEQGVPLEEVQAKWADGIADGFSRLSGRLEPFQRAYLEQQAGRYRPERVLRAAYRRRWQADFLALLAHRGDAERLERGLRRLAAARPRYYGPELTAVEANNETLTRTVSVWLLNSLNERQRRRLSDRLTDLARDFRDLAAQDVAPAPPQPPPPQER